MCAACRSARPCELLRHRLDECRSFGLGDLDVVHVVVPEFVGSHRRLRVMASSNVLSSTRRRTMPRGLLGWVGSSADLRVGPGPGSHGVPIGGRHAGVDESRRPMWASVAIRVPLLCRIPRFVPFADRQLPQPARARDHQCGRPTAGVPPCRFAEVPSGNPVLRARGAICSTRKAHISWAPRTAGPIPERGEHVTRVAESRGGRLKQLMADHAVHLRPVPPDGGTGQDR